MLLLLEFLPELDNLSWSRRHDVSDDIMNSWYFCPDISKRILSYWEPL